MTLVVSTVLDNIPLRCSNRNRPPFFRKVQEPVEVPAEATTQMKNAIPILLSNANGLTLYYLRGFTATKNI
jgi:hypothetical protein